MKRKAVTLQAGGTWENGKIRIQQYRDSLQVTDLMNAGKRGKTVDYFTLRIKDRDYHGTMWEYTDRMDGQTTYAEALEEVTLFLEELDFHEAKARGVDVIPGNTEPVKIHNAQMYLQADPKGFQLRDLRDLNEASAYEASRGDAAKAFAFFQRSIADLQNFSYRDVLRAMDKAGIRYKTYFARD